MPPLSKDTWEEIRAEREEGASVNSLSIKYGVSRKAINNHEKREQWLRPSEDLQAEIRKRIVAKVAGVATPCDPAKKAAALNAEADRGVEVLRRHRQEVDAVRERLYSGLKAHKAAEDKAGKQHAFEYLKAAKISSEVLINLHKLERQAWGLDLVATGEIIITNPREVE